MKTATRQKVEFENLAGTFLEHLNQVEIWDLMIVLCQSLSLATMDNSNTVDTLNSTFLLEEELEMSDNCKECCRTLNKSTLADVKQLMVGILLLSED